MKKNLYRRMSYFIPVILLSVSCSNDQFNITKKKMELQKYDIPQLSSKYESIYFDGKMQTNLSSEALAEWWTILEDETLTELIRLSLNNNKNLQEAKEKVNEARAMLGISKAELLPWLDSNNSWTRKKTSDNSLEEKGIANTYKLGIDASWEIDIFGENRYKTEAAKADLQMQYAQLHSTWVSLSSEVAINYISLRTLQERLDITENNLKLQKDIVHLLQSKYSMGLIDELNLNQAKYTASQIEASIPTIKLSIEETMNTLALLTGQMPGSLEEKLSKRKPLPQINEKIYIGIPAETLRQRPDIQAAEYQLEAQIARTKSAKAELKPKLILFGSIGLESISSGSLLSSGSKGFVFGPQISFPIFHAGAIKNNIKVQTAREEQFLAAYENSILNAVGEVRNALTSIYQEKERNISLKEGVKTASIALGIAQDKYLNGLEDFQNVLDTQKELLSLQEQATISNGQEISNLISLFKALGGGWKPLTQENIK